MEQLLERWSPVSWTCGMAGAKKLQKPAAHKPFWGGLQGVLGDKLLREIPLACALTMAISLNFCIFSALLLQLGFVDRNSGGGEGIKFSLLFASGSELHNWRRRGRG